MVLCFSSGLTIIQFPEDTYVEDGEGVLFRVEVSGAPHPELVWYHNGVRVAADYSMELAEDGSLTMPSAELKHSGMYKLVASNPAGSVEGEVRLVVEKKGGKDQPQRENWLLSLSTNWAVMWRRTTAETTRDLMMSIRLVSLPFCVTVCVCVWVLCCSILVRTRVSL